MRFFGNDEDEGESGDLLGLILTVAGFLCVAGGLFEISQALVVDTPKGRIPEHSMLTGFYYLASSLIWFWMAKVIDLLGK